jgi:hypothetical protein
MRNRQSWTEALRQGPDDVARADRTEDESIRRFLRLRRLSREVGLAARTADVHLRLDLALRLERDRPPGEGGGHGR